MRRLVLVSAATLSLLGAVVARAATASAGTTPPVPSDGVPMANPILGTWTLIDVSDPESAVHWRVLARRRLLGGRHRRCRHRRMGGDRPGHGGDVVHLVGR